VTELRHTTGDRLSAVDLYALLLLRSTVFVVEQECPYPELDGRDLLADTEHLWWQPADTPLACLRLLAEPDGGVRVGRVCTAADARGQGLSGRLMIAALDHIGDAPSVLDAQTHAASFYARFGYEPVGEPFVEDDIEHITMRRAGRV
jgi:ElaA protein